MDSVSSTNKESAAPAHKTGSAIRPFIKPLLVLCVLSLGLIIVARSPLKSYLAHVELVRDQIEALGQWGPPVFIACVAGLITLGVPRILFFPIGGLAFGFLWGLIWTQIATMIGYYAIFLFVRWGGRDFVVRHFPRVSRMHRVFHKHAIPTIILIRQLPISGLPINLLLGLSPISHLDFLVGTVIGILPEAIPMAAIGSSAIHLTAGQGLAWVAGLLAVVIVLWLVFSLALRSSRMFAQVESEYEEEAAGEPKEEG